MQDPKKTILLIDGNVLKWRAAYSLRKSSNNNIAQRILTYFFDIIKVYEPIDLVVCWDKGQSRWRTDAYPPYKAPRLAEKKADDLDFAQVKEQTSYVKRYLTSLGIRQIEVSGVEADDMLGWLSDYYAEAFKNDPDVQIIISTGDHDLWQLIREDKKVEVYDSQKGIPIDADTVRATYGVGVDQFVELKALMGDVSDNLPGIKGIGEKTGAKLLEKYGSLGNLMNPTADQVKELSAKKTMVKILDDGCSLGDMYRLVKIPSIREAIHYLNEVEKAELRKQLIVQEKDSFKNRILAERIGGNFTGDAIYLPSPLLDLGGMVEYMKAHSPVTAPLTSLAEIDRAILGCARCPLRNDCGEFGPTLPSGYENAEIMIVGRNPGEQELRTGKVFYSDAPAGGKLDEFLNFVGLTRDECWITNACKCYSLKNRPPTQGELQACTAYLQAEINIIQPKLIIAFGTEAMMMTTPYMSRITKHCGEILDGVNGIVGGINAKVAICIHPSAALRSGQGQSDFQYAATQVKRLLDKVSS